MRLVDEAQDGGDGDIGMADAAIEPVIAVPAGAFDLKDTENGGYLCPTAIDPDVGHFAVQALFVEETDGLFAQTRGKSGDLQGLAPSRLGGGEHRAAGGHKAVEIVQDAVTFDQHFT